MVWTPRNIEICFRFTAPDRLNFVSFLCYYYCTDLFFFLYCRNQRILREWLCGSPRAVSNNSIAYPLWSVAGSWRTRCVHPQDLFRSDFRNPTTIIYTNWSVIVLALFWKKSHYFICIFSRIEFIMQFPWRRNKLA